VQILVTDAGDRIELDLDDARTRPFGGVRALNNRRIHLRGRWLARGTGTAAFAAESVELEAAAQAAPLPGEPMAAVEGSRKFVNVLCRFADSTGVTPKPTGYFAGLMSPAYPGLDHYWRDASFGKMNIEGTVTAGWYNLPRNWSYYIYDKNGDNVPDADLNRLAQDCTAAADADVYFPDFAGVNLMFNKNLDAYAWGGTNTLSRDGVTKQYSMTWLPPWAYENQCVLAHEMGHGFGLPHSSGPYGETYDSPWDVMSDNWASSIYDIQYGRVGVHTISYHKDLLGWIPASRKITVNAGTRKTIALDSLALPAGETGTLMATVPIPGQPNVFYTVEARRFRGYDGGLPGEAVVIHRVDTLRDRPAQVVDADSNGDPGDAGSMWIPGETFSDAAYGITVEVKSYGIEEGTITVTIASGDVEDAGFNDFDGDGIADAVVWRPGTGVWYAASSSTPGGSTSTLWGNSTDTPVAADYDGDGKTDIAVWRPGTGIWYVRPSSVPGTYTAKKWGAASDFPLPADYDGDGSADLAAWRAATGVWYVLPSAAAGNYTATQWGAATGIGVPADYDGDGKSDIAVWRPGTGTWYVRPSASAGTYTARAWGLSSDLPIPGDYDGDGKADTAVWRPGTGVWYIRPSASPESYTAKLWGMPSDIPVPGDYDGDGKADVAVWRPGSGTWYIVPSGNPSTYRTIRWGAATDKPVSQITDILEILP